MKRILIIIPFTLLLVGCFHERAKREAPTKREAPEEVQTAVPPGEITPAQEKKPAPTLDENDYLDQALKELEEIE